MKRTYAEVIAEIREFNPKLEEKTGRVTQYNINVPRHVLADGMRLTFCNELVQLVEKIDPVVENEMMADAAAAMNADENSPEYYCAALRIGMALLGEVEWIVDCGLSESAAASINRSRGIW